MDLEHDEKSTIHPDRDDLVIVSIVGFRNADDIETCLTALARTTYPNFIVAVCENGGAEAFETLVQRLHTVVSPAQEEANIYDQRVERIWTGVLRGKNQPVHLLQAKSNLGFAGGVNVTVEQFSSNLRWKAVWLLNPDAEPEPGALSALERRAEETGAFIVGGRLVFPDTGLVQLYGGRWRPWIARAYNIGMNRPKDSPVDTAQIESEMNYVAGASMYVSRAFIDKVGLMDDSYFLYCEEVDWCLRIENKRQIRYADQCTVYHRHGTTIGSNLELKKRSDLSIYLAERNKLLLSRRFYPNVYPMIVLIALFLLLQYFAKGSSNKAPMGFRGWLAGLRGERGPPPFLTDPG